MKTGENTSIIDWAFIHKEQDYVMRKALRLPLTLPALICRTTKDRNLWLNNANMLLVPKPFCTHTLAEQMCTGNSHLYISRLCTFNMTALTTVLWLWYSNSLQKTQTITIKTWRYNKQERIYIRPSIRPHIYMYLKLTFLGCISLFLFSLICH